jgi:hypothetical protein
MPLKRSYTRASKGEGREEGWGAADREEWEGKEVEEEEERGRGWE